MKFAATGSKAQEREMITSPELQWSTTPYMQKGSKTFQALNM